MVRKVVITLVLLGLVVPIPGLGIIWQVERFPPFIIHFHPQDSKNVPGVTRALSTEYPVIQGRLGVRKADEIKVFIAPRERDFQQLSQASLPMWVGGYAIPSQQMMVLKSPSFSKPMRELQNTAVHELVHLALESEMGDVIIPRWLNEGLAVTLSGEGVTLSKSILSWAILSGRLLDLMDIEHVMGMSAQDARLAYLESVMAVDYLRLQGGWDGIRELLDQLKATEDFDSAMVRVYGVDETGFEWEFLKKIRHQYRWAILIDPMFYISAAFIPLLGMGGFMVWRRKRRIRKEWEDEDQEQYWEERNP